MSKSRLIKGIAVSALATSVAMTTTTATAADEAQWKMRVGVSNIDPKSDNGALAGGSIPVDVKDDTMITFNGVYMIRPDIGIELLAALPFEHDIAVAGGPTIGSTKHLPPTLSAQYYFNNASRFTPYLGVGLNYTLFFSEKLNSTGQAAVGTSDISLDNSLGFAYQAGVDFDLNEQWLLNLDLRKIDIDTDVKIGGSDAGTVNIDPTVVSLNVGYKF